MSLFSLYFVLIWFNFFQCHWSFCSKLSDSDTDPRWQQDVTASRSAAWRQRMITWSNNFLRSIDGSINWSLITLHELYTDRFKQYSISSIREKTSEVKDKTTEREVQIDQTHRFIDLMISRVSARWSRLMTKWSEDSSTFKITTLFFWMFIKHKDHN